MEVVASLSQGRTAAAHCGLFTYKSVPVIFEPPCMSCLLRLSTPLESNFKALFSSTNRLRALSDAILLLAGRRHVGHKNAYRLNADESACTLVAGTQDVA